MKTKIPKDVKKAEKFVAISKVRFMGRQIPDSVEPRLLLDVQKTVASYRVRVKIAGKWLLRTIGRSDEVTIVQARAGCAAVREHGCSFNSDEDFDFVIRRALAQNGRSRTVLEAFEMAMAGRVQRGRIKDKTVKSYRLALVKAGEEFCSSPLNSIDSAILRKAAKKVQKTRSRSLGNFRIATYWAWEHEIENLTPGVETNLSYELKNLRLRQEESAASPRDSLTWEELRAFWQWLSDCRCPLSPVEIRLYKTMLLVGERIGSLCHAQWRDLGGDNWWVIPPERRKHQQKLIESADPLFIYITEPLRDILGKPLEDGWVFPSKTDPLKAFSYSSLPLRALFRARDLVWLDSGRAHLISQDEADHARKYAELRYTTFPIPDQVPRCCHHEAGRHTLSTLAQELGIPGILVSKMLGHADDQKLPGIPDLETTKFTLDGKSTAIPRAMLRQAEASQGAASITRKYYTHLAPSLPAIRAAWLTWTEAFCRNVIGEVPQSVMEEIEELRGPEDKIIAILSERFGNLDLALQAIIQNPVPGHFDKVSKYTFCIP